MMDSQERERRLALLRDGEEEVEEVDLAPPKTTGSVVVSVRLPAQMADSLAMQAEREDKATGTLARELIENGLGRRPEASIELLASVFSRLASRMERVGLFTHETTLFGFGEPIMLRGFSPQIRVFEERVGSIEPESPYVVHRAPKDSERVVTGDLR